MSEAFDRVQEKWLAKVRAMAALGFHVQSTLAQLPPTQVQPKYRRKSDVGKVYDRAALVRFHANKRRAAKLRRTPPWADLDAMRAIYNEAQRLTRETGIPHHVDHVIPLQGELVSGLHVVDNLQILTASENSRKRNKYEP